MAEKRRAFDSGRSVDDPLALTVLVFKEACADGHETVVAQVIEHDFAVQGASASDAMDNLVQMIQGQARLDVEAGRRPITWLPPAPDEFRRRAAQIASLMPKEAMPSREFELFPSEDGPVERPVVEGPTRLHLAAVA